MFARKWESAYSRDRCYGCLLHSSWVNRSVTGLERQGPWCLKAVFIKRSGGLLCRFKSKGRWQKRLQNGEWHDVEAKTHPKGIGEELEVRPELQVVIPHPTHVKEFLGDSDFEIVEKLAKNPHDRMVDIPFLSRFYNFRQPPAQGT